MSTKGLPVKAACDLANALTARGVRVFALHDFDLAGFKILKTLLHGTRLARGTKVTEIGLRMADIVNLDSEPVEYRQKKDPKKYLAGCGATAEEQRFLVESSQGNTWFGRRVEINSMTSERLVRFLEEKLAQHGVQKVVPKGETLASAYRRAMYLRELQSKIEEWKKANECKAPKRLIVRVKKILAKDPSMSWDNAVWQCAGEDSDEEE
jgi:hypothetical protein